MQPNGILTRRLPQEGFVYVKVLPFAHVDVVKSIITAINDVFDIESNPNRQQTTMDEFLAEIFEAAREFVDKTNKPSLIALLRSWEIVTGNVSWTKDKVSAASIEILAEYVIKARLQYLEWNKNPAPIPNGFAGRTVSAVDAYIASVRARGFGLRLPSVRTGVKYQKSHMARVAKPAQKAESAKVNLERDVAMAGSSVAEAADSSALPIRPALKRKADAIADENQVPAAKHRAVEKLARK